MDNKNLIHRLLVDTAVTRDMLKDVKGHKKELEADDDYVAAKEAIAELGGRLDRVRGILLKLAKRVYVEGDNKKLEEGLSVRDKKVFEYDEDELIQWLIEHKHFDALKVNWVEAKKIVVAAKANVVSVKTVLDISIPTKLPKYLDEGMQVDFFDKVVT